MRFVNLTPHRVSIYCEGKASLRKVFDIEPSGQVARVATVNERASTLPITRTAAHGECGGCGMELDYVGKECACEALGIPWAVPTVRTSYGEVTGLPEPWPNVVFIVSGMVAAAAPRADVMSPGESVRDASGRVVGCHGLRRSV